ncbi:MAG TPA: hypothetical protein PLL88_01200 [Anaerolineaceae bacterium]|nr:hypothetical protein [Anaerolineaceae bacterium]
MYDNCKKGWAFLFFPTDLWRDWNSYSACGVNFLEERRHSGGLSGDLYGDRYLISDQHVSFCGLRMPERQTRWWSPEMRSIKEDGRSCVRVECC